MTEEIRIGSLRLRFLRSRHDTGGSLDLFEMTVAPTGRMPVPHHHRDWEETVYGLAGVLHYRVGSDTVAIGPGDSLFVPRGIVHGFDNRSGSDATVLTVLTPGALGPDYFRELAALAGDGPPDPVAMKAVMDRYGLVPAPDP